MKCNECGKEIKQGIHIGSTYPKILCADCSKKSAQEGKSIRLSEKIDL